MPSEKMCWMRSFGGAECVYENICLPHASLRVPLPPPRPPNGTGSATTWQPRPPARAAGLTDRGWPLREGWRFRVPPWPQPGAG
jgi:hypothetical protein